MSDIKDDVKISSEKLQHFKLNGSTGVTREQALFMLDYVRALMLHSRTPDLRSYWTIVYKYLKIQLREKEHGDV